MGKQGTDVRNIILFHSIDYGMSDVNKIIIIIIIILS